MTEWREIGKRSGRPTRDDTVSVQAHGSGHVTLALSANLCVASRATVLGDENGRLAVLFSEDGAVRVPIRSNGRQGRIQLRKAASRLFPANFTGPVPWHREGDLIVIDPKAATGGTG